MAVKPPLLSAAVNVCEGMREVYGRTDISCLVGGQENSQHSGREVG